MFDWQDISTAPKDGSEILGAYEMQEPEGLGWLIFPMFFHDLPEEEGWVSVHEMQNKCRYGEEVYPTHWMPLPPPPEGPQEEKS